MSIVGKGIVKTTPVTVVKPEEGALPTPDISVLADIRDEESDTYFYNGSELLSDGHAKKIVDRKKNGAQKRQYLLDNVRKIYKASQEAPLTQTDPSEDVEMLLIRHRGMANRTMTVGSVAVIFDDEGIAKVHPRNKHVYEVLVRQPGFQMYSRPKPKKAPAPKKAPVAVEVDIEPLPAPTKAELRKPVVEEVVEEDEVVEETFVATGTLEIDDDEEDIPDTLDFMEFTKAELQDALEASEMPFKSNMKKAELVSLITEVWDDLELREILYDTLMQEG